MSRYLVREVVHAGHRIDARDAGYDDPMVRLTCEKRQFMAVMYGAAEAPLPLYRLEDEAWWVDDPIDCMTCLVLEARLA